MDEERMTYWSKAVATRLPLGKIDHDELDRVLDDDDVYYIAGFIIAASGGIPKEDEVVQIGDTVRSNLAKEMIRREYAATRPKLFPLRDLPVSELGHLADVSDREFILGLAYTIRERTGLEITAEEAAKEIDRLL